MRQFIWPMGLLPLGLFLVPVAALAQDGGAASSRVWVDDLSVSRSAGTAMAVEQLKAQQHDAASRTGAADLPPSSAPHDVGTAQLAPATRSSEPPHNLSSKQQGQLPAPVRVEGADRCDPKQPGAQVDASCAHVIETRSGEFSAPAPAPMTAEQRLLAAQARGERGLAAEVGRGSATDLASGASAPDERTSQELAAQLLVAQEANPQETPQPQSLPEGVDSQLIEVLQGLPLLVNQPQ